MMKTGYRWKVYYGMCFLHEDDEGWESEDDAYDEAKAYVESEIKYYDAFNIDYDEDEFSIIVVTPDGNEICY